VCDQPADPSCGHFCVTSPGCSTNGSSSR
jgi:hypothetical protein